MKAPDFTNVLKDFDKYYRIEDKNFVGFNHDLAIEARKRILHIIKILNILDKLIGNINKFHKNFELSVEVKTKLPKGMVSQFSKDMSDAELYSDIFYYISFRLISILERLPNLAGIKKDCNSIILTRNHLIEHPEGKNSGVFLQGFSVGAWGPVVKAVRYEDQKDIFPAKPLYEDAELMKKNIEKRLVLVFS